MASDLKERIMNIPKPDDAPNSSAYNLGHRVARHAAAEIAAEADARIEALEAEVEGLSILLTAARATLKQALLFAQTRRDEVLWFVQENRTARDLGRGDAFMEMCRHLSVALATLPTKGEDDGE